MTSTSRRILAALTLSLVTFTGSGALIACGSAPQTICVGPETPDDLEDLVDRDIVRHPDAACAAGDPLFAFVSVEHAPEIGAELGESDRAHYHSTHVVLLRSRSTNRTPGVQQPTRPAAAPATRSQAPAAPRTPAAGSPTPTGAPVASQAPTSAAPRAVVPSVAPPVKPKPSPASRPGRPRR